MAEYVQTQVSSTSTEGRAQATTQNGGTTTSTSTEAERTDTRTEHTPAHEVVTVSVRDGATSTTEGKAHIGINVRFRLCVRTIEGVAEGGSDLLSC